MAGELSVSIAVLGETHPSPLKVEGAVSQGLRWLIGAGSARELGSSLEPAENSAALLMWTLSPVRLHLTPDPQEHKLALCAI